MTSEHYAGNRLQRLGIGVVSKSKIYGRYQDEQDNLQHIDVRQTPLYLPPEPMGGTAQLFG